MCFENRQPQHSSGATQAQVLFGFVMQNNYLVNWENIPALDNDIFYLYKATVDATVANVKKATEVNPILCG